MTVSTPSGTEPATVEGLAALVEAVVASEARTRATYELLQRDREYLLKSYRTLTEAIWTAAKPIVDAMHADYVKDYGDDDEWESPSYPELLKMIVEKAGL